MEKSNKSVKFILIEDWTTEGADKLEALASDLANEGAIVVATDPEMDRAYVYLITCYALKGERDAEKNYVALNGFV